MISGHIKIKELKNNQWGHKSMGSANQWGQQINGVRVVDFWFCLRLFI